MEARNKDIREIVSQPSWASEGGFVWWIDDLLENAHDWVTGLPVDQ